LRQLADTPLKTGIRLWYRTSEASFGSAVASEESQEFDDGSTQPDALFRNGGGSEQWVRRRSLRKVWTE